MSASLVGSEMCIRDSTHPATCHGHHRGTLLHNMLSPRPTPSPDYRAYPVSYTHLTLPTICSV
eukprot:8133903-Alexandrium_andersonii.AAC.1